MELSTRPAIWQSHINAILSSIHGRSKYVTIMDDLLLHSSKHNHLKYLEVLLKTLLKSGLKISPKKGELLRTESQYIGNTTFIKDRRACSIPLNTRLEFIHKLKLPEAEKDY